MTLVFPKFATIYLTYPPKGREGTFKDVGFKYYMQILLINMFSSVQLRLEKMSRHMGFSLEQI